MIPIATPHLDQSPIRIRLATPKDGTPASMERAVMRPVDLSASHGIVLKAENLRRMAETYDPTFEAAMLNFDHTFGGPSHGHCTRLWMEGEFLWARFDSLSREAVDGIQNGTWPRCSGEFYPSHPVSKDWYFVGLALLGSKSPAVPGLPPPKLLSRPAFCLTAAGELKPAGAPPQERAAELAGEVMQLRERVDRELELLRADRAALDALERRAPTSSVSRGRSERPRSLEGESALAAKENEVQQLRAEIARQMELLRRERAQLGGSPPRIASGSMDRTQLARHGFTEADLQHAAARYPEAFSEADEPRQTEGAMNRGQLLRAGCTEADLLRCALKHPEEFSDADKKLPPAAEWDSRTEAQRRRDLSRGLTDADYRRLELKYGSQAIGGGEG